MISLWHSSQHKPTQLTYKYICAIAISSKVLHVKHLFLLKGRHMDGILAQITRHLEHVYL